MTRKTRSFFALTLLLLASIPSFAATVPIKIQNSLFQPNTITINLGDRVKWTNQDFLFHTTTSDSALWDSGPTPPNGSFIHVFDKAGTFTYHCTIHPGMTGTVKVLTVERTHINIGKDIIKASPKQLPITLNLTGKNPKQVDQVYLGSYIVNAQGACADCHSCPTYAAGHDPYKGEPKQFNADTYLAGGRAFLPSPFVSRNITPDSTGKPAGLTLAQFKHLLRTGDDPDAPGNTLQVMPWPIYGMMSDHDLEAVYAYLGSIPKATTPPSTACQ